ncbi:MAG: heavy metal translocating P-type ATPase [Chloroflexi bacterium]|nr:heavy metal translocating P-type ATPase [Chloroflexota bacterium]
MSWLGSIAGGGGLYVTYRVIRNLRLSRRPLIELLTLSDLAVLPDETGALAARVDEETQEIKGMILASATAMGVSLVGVGLLSPLLVLSGTLVVFTTVNIIQAALYGVFVERRPRIAMIDSIAIVALLATGNVFAAALTNTLYWSGRYLLKKTEDRTQADLANVFGTQPRFVWCLVDGAEIRIPFTDIQTGDHIVVNAGEVIPSDGLILSGSAAVDQRMLTGEAQPAEKGPGSEVLASTMLIRGRIVIEVARAGQNTVAAQIGEILLQTTDYREVLEARSSQFADRSVMPTLGVSLVALLALGPVAGTTALMANFSEVLRFVAPLGMLNYLTLASKNGILIKDGRALEELSYVDTVIFDKTGTLTLETPTLKRVIAAAGHDEDDILRLLATAEYRQPHPIAKAIEDAATAKHIAVQAPDATHVEIGYGLRVMIDNRVVRVGSRRFMDMEGVELPEHLLDAERSSHTDGHTLIFVAVEGEAIGAAELRATIRPEAQSVVAELHTRGLEVYIISGDHERPTRRLAAELGIDHYFAGVLPKDKAALVQQLQDSGRRVCFVGDGINDSIALKQANVSISINGAARIATDTAQIVLMDGTLRQLRYNFELARNYRTTLHSNVGLTVAAGVLCVTGVFFLQFGILSSIVLYNVNLVVGVANATYPLLRSPLDAKTLPT